MIRFLLTLLATLGLTAITLADPVKKVTVVVSDKLSKECAEAFVKALLDNKVDDAIKLCATPFRTPDGKTIDALDGLKRKFDRGPPPAGTELKVGDVLALDKFKERSKKKGEKELSEDTIKDYGEFLGKDGRIVLIVAKVMGEVPPDSDQHMLIRIKDGKAQIVGVGFH